MSQESKLIHYLRKRIPDFKCKEGCFDCCGVIIFSKWEWEQIKNKRKASSLTCPYASEKGCEIYEQRPILCRLYGTVEKMICPHGCGPALLLSLRKEIEIMDKYKKLLGTDEYGPRFDK